MVFRQPQGKEERAKKKRKRHSLVVTAKNARSIFASKRESRAVEPVASLGHSQVIPTISDDQKAALFRSKIDTIIDANETYKLKTKAMHKQIYELEEVCFAAEM